MQIFFIIVLLVIVILVGFAGLLFHKACGRTDSEPTPVSSAARPLWAESVTAGKTWFLSQSPDVLLLESQDGLKLRAYYLDGGSNTTLILMHGYKGHPLYEFAPLVKRLHEKGYNLLLPFQRAHTKSEGKYLSFGLKEREDAVRWTEYLNQRFSPVHLFLYGISMGGATVTMTSALSLPENVRGIIADCPYGDAGAQFCYSLKHKFHLPARLFLHLCGIWSRILGGWHFTDFSIYDLEHSRLPLLILHGDSDTTVPLEMSLAVQKVYGGECTHHIFKGCAHAYANLSERERYDSLVTDFIQKHS